MDMSSHYSRQGSAELSLHEPSGEPAYGRIHSILVKRKQTLWEAAQHVSPMQRVALGNIKVTKSSLQQRGHAGVCMSWCVNTIFNGTISD